MDSDCSNRVERRVGTSLTSRSGNTVVGLARDSDLEGPSSMVYDEVAN